MKRIISAFLVLGVILVFAGCATLGNPFSEPSIIMTYHHPQGNVSITLPPGIPDFANAGNEPDMIVPFDPLGIVIGVRYGVPPDYADSYGLIISGYEPIIYVIWEYKAEGETDRNWKIVDGQYIPITLAELDAYLEDIYATWAESVKQKQNAI